MMRNYITNNFARKICIITIRGCIEPLSKKIGISLLIILHGMSIISALPRGSFLKLVVECNVLALVSVSVKHAEVIATVVRY